MNPAKKTYLFAALAVIFALSSFSVSAGKNHYRWIDDRGNPVHSDRPPPKGVDYEVISTGSTLSRPVSADEGAVPAEIKPRVGNEFEQVDNAPPEIEKNPEYCQRAKDNLDSLDTAPRIRIRNEEGEYRYLSDAERATERQKAVSAIETHCE